MKTSAFSAVVLFGVAIAGGAGYWLGSRDKAGHGGMAAAPAAAPAAAGAGQPAGKKLLYYRNPMGLPDTSPVPKKDAMGMDYIPVWEGADDDAAGEVRISTARVQKLGVKVEAASRRIVSRPIRAAGRIEIDERRRYTVATKFEGWIERLHVNVTGRPVAKGQPLFDVYAPELVSAQREYQIAAQGMARLQDAPADAREAMARLADAALARLSNWDISAGQIEHLRTGGEVARTLAVRAPAGGVVLEKQAVAGMRFMPGETLFRIADLGVVWAVADVFERDIAAVRVGQKVRVMIDAYPGRHFDGVVSHIYPTLQGSTRTVPVRVDLPNPDGLLRPQMYAAIEFAAAAGQPVVAVPNTAVIDSGARQVVIVQKAAGRFEPRTVRLGVRDDDHVEVLEGVAAGELVVTAANFLIDAESNLKAALGSLQEPPRPAVTHQASGIVDATDARSGTLTVTHAPVASLKWPAMTMEFVAANPALVANLQPGTPIRFEFVERQPGEWVMTTLTIGKH